MFQSIAMDHISESNCLSTQSLNTNIRLPRLELNKFDGGFKKLAYVLGQFKKINDDSKLDEEGRFQ